MQEELWQELVDYPGYAVSSHGRIINTQTDLIKNPAVNAQGVLMVNFSHKQQQSVRSVALLVARTFLGQPPRPNFDTPICLDGNRHNCNVENLAWRPRWFAVKYNRQFDPWQRENRYGTKEPIVDMDSGEQFMTSWDAAVKYGLLDVEIFLAITNNSYVFPTMQRFKYLEA